MQEKYLPKDFDGCLAHVAQEAAELIQAVTKAQMYGIHNHHPETKEVNIDGILREYGDLQESVKRFFQSYQDEHYNKTDRIK